jgi:hypothetical protein
MAALEGHHGQPDRARSRSRVIRPRILIAIPILAGDFASAACDRCALARWLHCARMRPATSRAPTGLIGGLSMLVDGELLMSEELTRSIGGSLVEVGGVGLLAWLAAVGAIIYAVPRRTAAANEAKTPGAHPSRTRARPVAPPRRAADAGQHAPGVVS